MVWKEFFKITKGKVITFSVLVVISLFSMFTGFTCGFDNELCWFLMITTPLYLGYMVPINLLPTFNELTLLFSLITEIIWLYFLACLIIFIFKKIKEKRNN